MRRMTGFVMTCIFHIYLIESIISPVIASLNQSTIEVLGMVDFYSVEMSYGFSVSLFLWILLCTVVGLLKQLTIDILREPVLNK